MATRKRAVLRLVWLAAFASVGLAVAVGILLVQDEEARERLALPVEDEPEAAARAERQLPAAATTPPKRPYRERFDELVSQPELAAWRTEIAAILRDDASDFPENTPEFRCALEADHHHEFLYSSHFALDLGATAQSETLQVLREALESTDADRRLAALLCLANPRQGFTFSTTTQIGRALVLELLRDPDPALRLLSPFAIAPLPLGERAIDTALALLLHPSRKGTAIERRVAYLIQEWFTARRGDHDARQRLAQHLLRHRSPLTQRLTLEKLTGRDIDDGLLQFVEDLRASDDAEVAAAADAAWLRSRETKTWLASKTVDELVRLVRAGSEHVRPRAVRLISKHFANRSFEERTRICRAMLREHSDRPILWQAFLSMLRQTAVDVRPLLDEHLAAYATQPRTYGNEPSDEFLMITSLYSSLEEDELQTRRLEPLRPEALRLLSRDDLDLRVVCLRVLAVTSHPAGRLADELSELLELDIDALEELLEMVPRLGPLPPRERDRLVVKITQVLETRESKEPWRFAAAEALASPTLACLGAQDALLRTIMAPENDLFLRVFCLGVLEDQCRAAPPPPEVFLPSLAKRTDYHDAILEVALMLPGDLGVLLPEIEVLLENDNPTENGLTVVVQAIGRMERGEPAALATLEGVAAQARDLAPESLPLMTALLDAFAAHGAYSAEARRLLYRALDSGDAHIYNRAFQVVRSLHPDDDALYERLRGACLRDFRRGLFWPQVVHRGLARRLETLSLLRPDDELLGRLVIEVFERSIKRDPSILRALDNVSRVGSDSSPLKKDTGGE